MADVKTLPATAPGNRLNVTDRLAIFARTTPGTNAIVCPHRRSSGARESHRGPSGALYDTTSFGELEAYVRRIATGLTAWGVPKGTRLALLVRPGIDFVTLVFALLRAGMTIVLVDPGLGRRTLIRSLSEAEPEGFVGIGTAQAARVLMRKRFPQARWNVTVGRRWLLGGKTLDELRAAGNTGTARENITEPALPTQADDAAAIIFTSGSTGPAKGVLYTHRIFDAQIDEIQATYRIEPGEIDLACFPLFALFNAAMGVTTVLPEMDFSRPASADPRKLLAAANDWHVSQAFASPAVWRVLSDHCTQTGERINSLRQVFSCGAPVPANVLRRTLACVGGGAKMHTPYGATECLPISTIEAVHVLSETSAGTDRGLGVCVGQKFDSIDWRVIRILDDPIATLEETVEQNVGEIGELIVRGPQVSREYATRKEANVQSKISDGNGYWHRTGDVGYFDDRGRFWYCGRKSQRVETEEGTLFTECVEAICNTHPAVRRSALVGVGLPGSQLPVLVVERNPSGRDEGWRHELLQLLNSNPKTRGIHHVLTYLSLPVDIRHNAKINRERLALWAARRLKA
jgi:acyl-CoA synthetase (AMP-forming)/AMP-acid ligase II